MHERIGTAERAHLEYNKVTDGRVLEVRLLQVLFVDAVLDLRMGQNLQRLPSLAGESVRKNH